MTRVIVNAALGALAAIGIIAGMAVIAMFMSFLYWGSRELLGEGEAAISLFGIMAFVFFGAVMGIFWGPK